MRPLLRANLAVFMAGWIIVVGASSAQAQGYGTSGGYLPFGGSSGGFVPFSGGPGGGLGVQPRMSQPATRTPLGGTSMAGGMRPVLGSPRGMLTPLSPLSPRGLMGAGGGMIQRSPSGVGGMGGMARPPVGGYPFRQPPSIVTPNASSPAMSM